MKSQSVLDKIRASGAKPIPAWKFAAARWGVRLALLVALAAAALAAGLAVIESWEPGMDMMSGRMGRFPPRPAMVAMPALWFSLAVAGLAFALAMFKRLPTGYRWRRAAVAGIVLSGIAAAGAALMAVGGPRMVDGALRAAVPGYSDWSDERREEFFRDQWMRPDEGIIAGAVAELSDGTLSVRGLDGSEWTVSLSGARYLSGSLSVGARVRAFGVVTGSGEFRAESVRPLTRGRDWRAPGPGMPGRRDQDGTRRDFRPDFRRDGVSGEARPPFPEGFSGSFSGGIR